MKSYFNEHFEMGLIWLKGQEINIYRYIFPPKWIEVSQQSDRKWEWRAALNAEEDEIWWPRPWKRESCVNRAVGLPVFHGHQLPWLWQAKRVIKSPPLNPGHRTLSVKLFSVFRVKVGRRKLQFELWPLMLHYVNFLTLQIELIIRYSGFP